MSNKLVDILDRERNNILISTGVMGLGVGLVSAPYYLTLEYRNQTKIPDSVLYPAQACFMSGLIVIVAGSYKLAKVFK